MPDRRTYKIGAVQPEQVIARGKQGELREAFISNNRDMVIRSQAKKDIGFLEGSETRE